MAARSIRRILVPRSAPSSPFSGEIRRADDLDVVIHTMRKRAPASRQGGKSLLEWIAARGGVQDRGGDIAAIGGDRWHLREPKAGAKDKKAARPGPRHSGRSRLLAPFNDAQGNMIGGGDERTLSIGNTLDAAISEGIFQTCWPRARTARRSTTACCSMPSLTSWAVRHAMPRKRRSIRPARQRKTCAPCWRRPGAIPMA
jgi:hypothetical protein